MPSKRGMALLRAAGLTFPLVLTCLPRKVSPSSPEFPHICPGEGCAVCAWQLRKAFFADEAQSADASKG